MLHRIAAWGMLCVSAALAPGCPHGCTSTKPAPAAPAPPTVPEPSRTEVLFCDLTFASGSAALNDDGKARLEKIASSLRTTAGPIDIRGYSDTSPIRHARPAELQRLSQARADAVKHFLADRGVPPDRMTATGMGSTNPKETRAASRRVEITWQE